MSVCIQNRGFSYHRSPHPQSATRKFATAARPHLVTLYCILTCPGGSSTRNLIYDGFNRTPQRDFDNMWRGFNTSILGHTLYVR